MPSDAQIDLMERKGDDEPPPVPVVPLPQRLERRFIELRESDATVRRYERAVARAQERIRETTREQRQVINVAIAAMRTQEKWLRQEAASQIRKEAGIQIIPGFKIPRERPEAARRRIALKFAAASTGALATKAPR